MFIKQERKSILNRIFSFQIYLVWRLFSPIWCLIHFPFSFTSINLRSFFRNLLYIRREPCRECYFNICKKPSYLGTGTGSSSTQNLILPFKEMPSASRLSILLEFISYGGPAMLHKYIHKRHQQFGPIFRERLGGIDSEYSVFVSSAKLTTAVFLNEGTYPRHPLPDAWKLYNEHHKCQRGLLFMNDEEWHRNRRYLNRFLINGNLNWIENHTVRCTEKLIDYWREKAAASRQFLPLENLETQLYKFSIEIICSIMFGCSIDLTSSERLLSAIEEITSNVNTIFKKTAILTTFPPKLANMLNLKIWKKFEETYTNVLRLGYDIIDILMDLSLKNDVICLLDEDDMGLFQRLHQAGMEVDVIKRIFVDLILGAGDTTVFTIEWALYLLSYYPNIREKICEEKSLEYVKGFIKETLRLYPVAPFIGRYADRDAVLGHYHVPKDTLLVVSLYTAGRDAAHFPNPFEVKPERWIRDKKTNQLTNVLQANGSLPFAIGRRSCVGQKMAMFQLQSFITEFSRNFEIQCVNKDPIDCILQLITIPDKRLQLEIKLLTEN